MAPALQQLSEEQLRELDEQARPWFVGPQLEILGALPPEERIEPFYHYVNGWILGLEDEDAAETSEDDEADDVADGFPGL